METVNVEPVIPIDEAEFESALCDVLGSVSFLPEGVPLRTDDVVVAGEALAALFAGCSVNTYDDQGVMTRDKGLVVRMANGAEFQLTIVRSR